MAIEKPQAVDITQDPALSTNKTATPSNTQYIAPPGTPVKAVTVNYVDPPLYGQPQLTIYNDPGGLSGQIQFNSGNTTFGSDGNLYWDNTNKVLRTSNFQAASATIREITGTLKISPNQLQVSGGSSGQVLVTDGQGHLTWRDSSGNGNSSPGGPNSSIQFNNNETLDGISALTFDTSTNTLNTVNIAASDATIYGNVSAVNLIANHLYGDGSNITNLSTVNYSNTSGIANIAYQVNVSNVTGIGNISTINLDGNASNVLHGNGVFSAAPATYSNSNVVTLLSNFGSNTISTTGNITARYYVGNGSLLTGLYSNSNVQSYLISNPQPGTYSNSNVASYLTDQGITNYSNTNVSSYLTSQGITNYSNSNVELYLTANPQPGTYSNSNVESYLTANPQPGTYSNSNVESYLTANPQPGTYSNSNVATYLTDQGITNYSNSNVESYLISNPQPGTYSNSNVATYLTDQGITNYSNSNVASYLIANPQPGTYSNSNVASYLIANPQPGTYSNSNVTTLLSGFGSNTISTTGNVNVGNIFATNLGNLSTLNKDGNASNILYGNGVFASAPISSTYGNSNVVTLLSSFGSNTITTTGNVGVGNISATNLGNVSALNLDGNSSNILYGNGTFGAIPVASILANGTSNVIIPTASGNVLANVAGSTVLTVYSGGIKVGGSGILQSPGGATSITLNNTGANIATANITQALNVTGNASVTGNVIVTANIIGNTNGFPIGYRDIPQITFSGNTTLGLTDAGKHYYSLLSTANTLTVPNNATVSFATGSTINIINQGTGNISVVQGTGVSMYLAGNSTSANRTLTSYGVASITKVATDTWFISGVGLL